MVNGIEHVAVVSKDTAALKDWYMEMYGGRVVYDNGKGTYFLQFADGSMIEFVTATDDKTADVEKQAGIRHLAFSVTPAAFDEIVAKLKADERVEEETLGLAERIGLGQCGTSLPGGQLLHQKRIY